MCTHSIVSYISNFFSPRPSLSPKDSQAEGQALLPAHLDGTVTPDQLNELDRGLRAIRDVPGGDTLLRALRAYGDATNNLPRIIIVHDAVTYPADATRGVSSDGTWRVNPLALQTHPDSGLQALAQLYETLTQPRLGKFYGVPSEHLPQPDAELQAHWDIWVQVGRPEERRTQAVDAMQAWVTETRYYGGLSYLQMAELLDLIAAGKSAPVVLDAPLDLSALGLLELPQMPPKVRILFIDHNWLCSLAHLPDDLRILRMNHALLPGIAYLKPNLVRTLTHQLQRLPKDLVELELDDNDLHHLFKTQGLQIEQWSLPSGLTTLSLCRNWLRTLPLLSASVITLRASGNRLSDISINTLKDASHLREADVSDNVLFDVPISLFLLDRHCNVNLSGNPLTLLVNDIMRVHGITEGEASLRLPDVLSHTENLSRRANLEQPHIRLSEALPLGAGPRIVYEYHPAEQPPSETRTDFTPQPDSFA
jgi:hypothetical protein